MPPEDAGTTAPGMSAGPRGSFTSGTDRVGPYRILHPLGEGGMGVVYLAVQDEPVRREVAVKVLRAEIGSAEVIARFQSERQSLALMEHPNITRVYDAGATESGLPYFVMERVTGVPITEYADAHALTVRARLGLFMQVCGAVQHAHQKGIIHRDLKPSNVLVTEADGAPQCKVIDFGIAKATAPAADAARLTATGFAVGTPAYMSPEQFVGTGVDVDTRSDIYSLGVLLYELLTGALPYDPSGHALWALAAMHATGDVRTPSDRYGALDAAERAEVARKRSADPDALRHALSGDLDAVLLKAMDRDRERRYATANDLARDLDNHLHDRPVTATAPSRTYRMRKFVRRHRAAVAFGSTLAVLLVGFTVAVTVQARQLARARRVAVARQGQAEELVGFMLGDLRGRLTPIGKLEVLDAVGQKAMAYFAAVPEQELSGEELYRRAEALQQLGQVRLDQSRLPEAAELFRQAIALDERLAARDSANTAWQLGLGHAHFWAGNVEWQRGSVDSAVVHFLPFVRISERLIARYPDSTTFRRELAYALSNIGSAREAKGDFAGAMQAYAQSLALRRELQRREQQGRDPARATTQRDLALAYNSMGVAQRKAGDLAGALASHRAELALLTALAGRDTSDRELQRPLGNAHAFTGITRFAMGDVDGALDAARTARGVFAALVARDAGNSTWRMDLAGLDNFIAQLLLARGDAATALANVDAGRTLLTPLATTATPNVRATRMLSSNGITQARALLALGRVRDGLAPVRRAIEAGESAVARRPGDLDARRVLGEANVLLGDLLARQDDAPGAAAAWSRALTVVDSAARATRHTELLALQATALLALDRMEDAGPIVGELLRRGYRQPAFVALTRAKGMSAAP